MHLDLGFVEEQFGCSKKEGDCMRVDIDFKTIVFEDGLKRTTFDTLEEVRSFIKEIGNRYRATWKCEYPDVTFYIVGYMPE